MKINQEYSHATLCNCINNTSFESVTRAKREKIMIQFGIQRVRL